MKRLVIVTALSLVLAGAAHGFGLGLGNRFGKQGAAGVSGTLAPPATGALLLEDGASVLLLEDGSSNLCLEGGC